MGEVLASGCISGPQRCPWGSSGGSSTAPAAANRRQWEEMKSIISGVIFSTIEMSFSDVEIAQDLFGDRPCCGSPTRGTARSSALLGSPCPACCHPMSHGGFQTSATQWPRCWLLVTHGASIKFTLRVHRSLWWCRSCVGGHWLGLAVLWAAAALGSDVVCACCELRSIFPFLLLLCRCRGSRSGAAGLPSSGLHAGGALQVVGIGMAADTAELSVGL